MNNINMRAIEASVQPNNMKDIKPSNNTDGLRNLYKNDIWKEFKKEIDEEITEVKRKLTAIMASIKSGGTRTTSVWSMVTLLVSKIQNISEQLAQGPIGAQKDFDAVSAALAALEEDIKNLEKKGELDPTGKKPGSAVTDADAKKFAKDLKAYKNATNQWQDDYIHASPAFRQKYYNMDNMFNKNLDVILSIEGQTIENGKSIGDMVANGDIDGLRQALQTFAYFHGMNVTKNCTYDDIFDDWMTGNSWFCKSDGIELFLHTELAGAIAENNDLLNLDGNKINNAVSVGSACVKAGTDQQQYMVSHQLVNG